MVNETIELNENEATIFFYLQKLLRNAQHKTEKFRRIWESTYTLIYENPLENGSTSVVNLSTTINKKDVNESVLEMDDKCVVKQVIF